MGPLEETVYDTYRLGNHLDHCELSLATKNLRLGLARALDVRSDEFDAYLREQTRASRMFTAAPGLHIGPLNLVDRDDAPKPNGDKKSKGSGWVSYTSGWDDFVSEYQAIRTQRVNARWVRLLGLVRATIDDDYRRAVRGTWMGVSAEGIAEAPALVKAIGDCLSTKKCDGLEKPDPFKNALKLTPNATADFGDFRKATTEAARVRPLKYLLKEIKPFLDYYDPVKQRGVRVSDSNTLIISLDSGDFRGYDTELGQIIEKFWKVGSDSIKVEWLTSTRSEPVFKFLFLPTPKSGSQIDYYRRTITIGQNSIESVPAHEVGRALGFRARAFSVWRPETCKYEDESKPDDLLSNGRAGTVTSAHWDALKKVYGVTKSTK